MSWCNNKERDDALINLCIERETLIKLVNNSELTNHEVDLIEERIWVIEREMWNEYGYTPMRTDP